MRSRLLQRVHTGDGGFALLVVLGSMTMVSLFLLAGLGIALSNTKPSRTSQDTKSAVAAAQAGIDEFVSRLNANDTYWRNGGVDPTNPAFTSNVPVPGSGQSTATYRYALLSTTTETALTGAIRLRVTGKSKDTTRDLIARLTPNGFLKYVYFTDLETTDPALFASSTQAYYDGGTYFQSAADANLFYSDLRADPGIVSTQCSNYWFAGRSSTRYTSGNLSAVEYRRQPDGSFVAGNRVSVPAGGHSISFVCQEIRFAGGDKLTGPVKTNDAYLINGDPWFTQSVYTGWAGTATPTPPSTPGPWRGGGVPNPAGYSPIYQAPLSVPASNSELLRAANTAAGCTYKGATRVTFSNNGKMKVFSPGTTTSKSGCYNASLSAEQTVDVPAVIYVEDSGTCGTGSVGYPMAGEVTTYGPVTDYDCHKGNAYVSGILNGQVTIGTANDVVVVGDLTYKDELTGDDALGLIPQNYCWIYHPVKADGTNLLSTPVRKLDAAVLSVNHSFLVQNFGKGAELSTDADEASKLRVRGAIAQKFRGPVGQTETVGSTTVRHGYIKDYQYDARLANAPPPYFLKPVASPWLVSKVTD